MPSSVEAQKKIRAYWRDSGWRDPAMVALCTEIKGMNKAQLSKESGVSVGAISRWFTKTRNAQVATLRAVGNVVGKTLDWVDRPSNVVYFSRQPK